MKLDTEKTNLLSFAFNERRVKHYSEYSIQEDSLSSRTVVTFSSDTISSSEASSSVSDGAGYIYLHRIRLKNSQS